MLTTLRQWFHTTFGPHQRRRSRRQVALQWSSAEVLEQRALMSATNGMADAVEQQADVSYADDTHMASDMMQHKSAAMTAHDTDRSLKAGSQKHQRAQTAAATADFTGDWFLGFDNDKPTKGSVMSIHQTGKKVTATITEDGITAIVKGKVKQGELRAKFSVPREGTFGTLQVRLVGSDEFTGTITITSQREETFTQALDGVKVIVK